jgi:hypothetical protein
MDLVKFTCPCGAAITAPEALVNQFMANHQCPEPRPSVWSYVFSDDSFFVWIGLFWALLAVAAVVEAATGKW